MVNKKQNVGFETCNYYLVQQKCRLEDVLLSFLYSFRQINQKLDPPSIIYPHISY